MRQLFPDRVLVDVTDNRHCAVAPRSSLPANFFWYDVTIGITTKKKPKKTFRNPIIQAKEMQLEMELEDLSKADLARKLRISRARITKMLNLLKLPEELIREVEEMGDYWERILLTERSLRKMRMDH